MGNSFARSDTVPPYGCSSSVSCLLHNVYLLQQSVEYLHEIRMWREVIIVPLHCLCIHNASLTFSGVPFSLKWGSEVTETRVSVSPREKCG